MEVADTRFTPPTYSANFNIYPNGHAAGTSRIMYVWAVPKDNAGNYPPGAVLTNPDGTPFPIAVSYQ